VRFAQQRWREAASLAHEAVDLNGADGYAWDVLGSSRFVLGDLTGALDAWNQVQRPRIDRVQIDGLAHTRYSLMAGLIGLTPGAPLTSHDLLMARRRVEQLPDREASRVAYRPDGDGFALVTVDVLERSRAPRGVAEWAAAGVQTIVNREAAVVVPGFSGQGEVWRASWRWWDERPRVAFGFSAPVRRWVPGIWHVSFVREGQTYRTNGSAGLVREERTSGTVGVANWLTPQLRYEAAAGLDDWDASAARPFLGGTIERRFLNDRAAIAASGTVWLGVEDAARFERGSIGAWARSSTSPRGFVTSIQGVVDAVSDGAPLALWSGAGEGRARPALLRGHRLLHRGVVDGSIFGRQLASVNAEGVQWLRRPALVPIGIAGFVDIAGVRRRLTPAAKSWQVDAGVGLRAKLPGLDGTLRVDYGRGLRDGEHALTIGWSVR
jgi:hypothetical protein